MPKQIELIQAEALPHSFHFIGVLFDRPKTRVVGLLRIGGVKLIVVLKLNSIEWKKVFESLEIPMICTGSPMQKQYLGASGAHLFGPDPMTSANFDPP